MYFSLVTPKTAIEKDLYRRLFLISQINFANSHQDSKPTLQIRSLFSVQNTDKANRKLLKSV